MWNRTSTPKTQDVIQPEGLLPIAQDRLQKDVFAKALGELLH